ncbi:MAG: YicC family protein [Syntrophomonadaceae bacterium]|nr:YicC family protein [Syntrophomonadaceae bacterium]MDD3022354.1 YicC family protein [Syntrophomonadaceae bacterium]
MVKSMTGFGRSQVIDSGYQVSCEIKSVNHRFLDFYIRLSRRYNILEERIKEEAKKYAQRGRLEISINIEKVGESARNIKLDKELAMAYYNYLKELAEKLNISQEIKVVDLFRLPEVFSLQDEKEDLEVVWNVLQQSIETAMNSMVEMRCKEGQNLAADILKRNAFILSLVEKLEARNPDVALEYSDKLRKRISELIPHEAFDEHRIIQEAAIFADKANITEEIVRLKSHVGHLSDLVASGETIGRKCDFLVQEMFREINTIASKANDLAMSQVVVEAKAELEKIREQLQNIE